MFTARTWLYVPGDRPDRMAKAVASGADAVIIDLEDAVAAPSKLDAREMAGAFVSSRTGTELDPSLWVRVNNEPALLDGDLAAAIDSGVDGVVIPKAEDVEALSAVSNRVTAHEAAAGRAASSVAMVALIESGAGVLSARDLLSVDRVGAAAVGEADLSADLGVKFTDDSPALLHARVQIRLASAAAAVSPPIGPVSVEFRNVDAFVASCNDLEAVGFEGRQVIHPAQVGPANQVFTPSAEQVEIARQLVRGFDEAEAAGVGVYLDPNGRMVDLAVIRSARRLLARAELATH